MDRREGVMADAKRRESAEAEEDSRKRRAAAAESRWQQGAMEQFDAAVHKRRRDGGA